MKGSQPRINIKGRGGDKARVALSDNGATVADVAARCGFRSSTTFASEYRKRFGVPPSHVRHARSE